MIIYICMYINILYIWSKRYYSLLLFLFLHFHFFVYNIYIGKYIYILLVLFVLSLFVLPLFCGSISFNFIHFMYSLSFLSFSNYVMLYLHSRLSKTNFRDCPDIAVKSVLLSLTFSVEAAPKIQHSSDTVRVCGLCVCVTVCVRVCMCVNVCLYDLFVSVLTCQIKAFNHLSFVQNLVMFGAWNWTLKDKWKV